MELPIIILLWVLTVSSPAIAILFISWIASKINLNQAKVTSEKRFH